MSGSSLMASAGHAVTHAPDWQQVLCSSASPIVPGGLRYLISDCGSKTSSLGGAVDASTAAVIFFSTFWAVFFNFIYA